MRVAGGIGPLGYSVFRGTGIGPGQRQVAFSVRRRSPHSQLDLLQSPPLQRSFPLPRPPRVPRHGVLWSDDGGFLRGW